MRRAFRPLRGVRILSFEAAFSLPAGTRTLAELGADVVQVSRPARASGDYITVVDGNALSKASLAVNLQHQEGLALARRLALQADAVCNNFRPRVMRRYGLDSDALRALKPELIVLQLSGYGTPGPWADFPAYGPSVEAAGGMNALSGGGDDPPVRVGSGVFADQSAGRYAALALMAALERRQRTGEGQAIDLSMYECIVHLLGDRLLSAASHGATPARRGNRDALHAPQGIYPCRGEDAWVALSVETDAQWRVLRELLAEPRLCDPSFETAEGRRCRHGEVDAAIAAWTRARDKDEVATVLQECGVPAGPVQTPADLNADPHLAARGAFSDVPHARPLLGAEAHQHLTTPWQALGFARHDLRDAPGDGADNARALRRWLGLRAGEVKRLEQDGALIPFRPFAPVEPAGGFLMGSNRSNGVDLSPRPPPLASKAVPRQALADGTGVGNGATSSSRASDRPGTPSPARGGGRGEGS